jgi:Fic family protein
MLFKLKKPNLEEKSWEKELPKAFSAKNSDEIFDFVRKVSESDYVYWDVIRYKEPFPAGITREGIWAVIKFFRNSKKISTPLKDKTKKIFTWSKLNYLEEFFHDIDMNTGGELFVEKSGVDKGNKQKLITRGIIEEAIASSQLEGAATSRQAAKKMLREGRKPKNKSEQMIVNSYLSMKSIEDDYKDRKMTRELLLEMHGLITKDTADSENETPRMRKKGEPVIVSDDSTGMVYHEAPNVDFVKKELDELIKFANDEGDVYFMHPIIKAIMLHFWLGYLHPFTDGNGRLARLLFYWYLLKKGYWAFAYLPISKTIKKSPKQYIMAYVYSEQDDNDLTYFIDYNIKKIKQAVREFLEYLDRQSKKNLQMKKMCEEKYNLNMRQVQVLQYLFGDEDGRTTLGAHMNVNQVSKMTASTDLKDLVKKGFLSSVKKGRNVYYYGTEKIKELF